MGDKSPKNKEKRKKNQANKQGKKKLTPVTIPQAAEKGANIRDKSEK